MNADINKAIEEKEERFKAMVEKEEEHAAESIAAGLDVGDNSGDITSNATASQKAHTTKPTGKGADGEGVESKDEQSTG